MATLQRSSLSYRREGSSGAVWSEKLLPELVLEKESWIDPNELRHSHSVGGPAMLLKSNILAKPSSEAAAAVAATTTSTSVTSPVYMSRSSSLSVSALKLLNPKSVLGSKFSKRAAPKPPKYGNQQLNLGRV